MTLRVVPNGDERDKDVANAIRYAVDNGAKVVNMSFGKDVGHMDAEVESAIRYAGDHDVLLVHAAGNDGHSVDKFKNYPNGWNEEINERYDHWIEVGASRYGDYEKLAAPFSNYGEQVDVFAPGYEIYSTVPESRYQSNSGTSMAAPVVSGIAALVRGMYPELSAAQVKSVILLSSIKFEEKVIKPGTKKKKVPFATLSDVGGVANLYTALALAQSIRDSAHGED
jgi:subtilisin family serine protease